MNDHAYRRGCPYAPDSRPLLSQRCSPLLPPEAGATGSVTFPLRHGRTGPDLFRAVLLKPAALLLFSLFLLLPAAAAMAADVNTQYQSARTEMDRLRADPKRGMQRDPWNRLAETFLRLYTANPQWNNAPAALYRSALALDELARRSARKKDAQAAVERYLQVSAAHPTAVLADDALFRAAKLRLERLDDPAGAKILLDRLEKDFSKGDMLPAAQALRRKLLSAGETASAPQAERNLLSGGTTSPALLTQVSWQSRRNLARVNITLDKATAWSLRSLGPDSQAGLPARLVLELPGVKPESSVKPGARVTGSLLTRLRVDLGAPGTTRILMDFSTIKRFSVKEGKNPFRLTITASATDGALPDGKLVGQAIRSASGRPGGVQVPSDIAEQLGLSLKTIVVDAGHGGNDPGTQHNGVVEKDVALDIALRLGKILEKQGLHVRYTRTDDTKVPLEERTRFANQTGGDLFLSVHVNAHPTNNGMSGIETYFLDFASSSAAARLAGVENTLSERHLGDLESLLADLMLGARTQESRRLADSVQRACLDSLKKAGSEIRDGGVRSAPFHVLLGSTMPGVLIEVGYCTNKAEAERLLRPAYRQTLAAAIARGVLRYAGRLAH